MKFKRVTKTAPKVPMPTVAELMAWDRQIILDRIKSDIRNGMLPLKAPPFEFPNMRLRDSINDGTHPPKE